jgi:hypothetical protein
VFGNSFVNRRVLPLIDDEAIDKFNQTGQPLPFNARIELVQTRALVSIAHSLEHIVQYGIDTG